MQATSTRMRGLMLRILRNLEKQGVTTLAAAPGPEPKGYLCVQDGLCNLHAARRVAANDRQGKNMLCRYILRPPLANERLHFSKDGDLTLEFRRPWSHGTRSIVLEPKALLARLSAIVPTRRRDVNTP